MMAVNRHTITPLGWFHEQDNYKKVSQTADILCREVGLNNYERTELVDFSEAKKYWAKSPHGKKIKLVFNKNFFHITLHKSNYKTTELAVISLIGEPNDKVKIMIINPTGGIVGNDIPVTLASNGKANHSLDLSGYSSGIYTAVFAVTGLSAHTS